MIKPLLISVLAVASMGTLQIQPNTPPVQLPPGTAPKQLNDQEDIRSVIATAASAGITKGSFADLTERLSSADRKRLGDFVKRDFPQLDARLEQLRTAWQAKYGQELKLDDKLLLERFVLVLEGEVTDTALARMHWPLRATGAQNNEPIQASESASSGQYLDKGRNVAVVVVPSIGDRPTLYVSMIHENVDDWRMDVPDSITGEQIFNNLITGLTRFNEQVDAWPSSVGEAQRQLVHVIVAAIYNVVPGDTRRREAASLQP